AIAQIIPAPHPPLQPQEPEEWISGIFDSSQIPFAPLAYPIFANVIRRSKSRIIFYGISTLTTIIWLSLVPSVVWYTFDLDEWQNSITSTVCDCFSPSPTSSSASSSSAQPTTQHDTLLLRLLSCLLSLTLSSSLPVHQSALLKAVRTVYNVFLLGRAGTVQTVTQATLGQIVGGVFGRIEIGVQVREAAGVGVTVLTAGPGGSGSLAAGSRSASRTDLANVAEEGGEVDGENASVESMAGEEEEVAVEETEPEPEPETPRVAPQEPEEGEGEAEQTPKLPQQELETEEQGFEEKSGETEGEAEREKLEESTETPGVSVSGEDVGSAGAKEQGEVEKIATENLAKLKGTPISTAPEYMTNDLYIKDAFLVFRASCKLSMKPLGADSERDLKPHAMRSKLLSLHLIVTILNIHMPSRFENAKLRKTTLLEGIKKFNFKPKRGVAFLMETGFIRSNEPKDIARFLLHADGLDKAQIGKYLGEGEPENIATMHAFVDYMEFSNMVFVDALRMFLQSFRLPGEAQKIDRYMLKFAERFTAGNPGIFANADTAYILAFSVILLNTDAHNPQVKKPMSKVEFIKNNRGIDDGKDLGEDFLVAIYDEINVNEIRMKDEV
ncbi:hypothetical protein JCM11641_007216, partial [Rhodosporidiobolus odoratus]